MVFHDTILEHIASKTLFIYNPNKSFKFLAITTVLNKIQSCKYRCFLLLVVYETREKMVLDKH